jgi:kynurenine formamidase
MFRKIIDLSVACSNKTKGVKIKLQKRLPVYLGQACYAYDLEIKSHTGTYFETSGHVFRKGKNTDEVPVEKLILPGRCVRVKDKCITAEKLNSLCRDLKPNCALLVDTGRDLKKYFSRDAAVWMAKRKVALMGSNLPRYDTGFTKPTGFFIDLFKAEIPIIVNITNLDKLPERGFTLIVMPLKIAGICTCPARVIAIIHYRRHAVGG